jgi:hypothetical protein
MFLLISESVAQLHSDNNVGSGAQIDLFTPTVPADDGCIDSPVDEFGFLVHV